jgi:hypothetical protein
MNNPNLKILDISSPSAIAEQPRHKLVAAILQFVEASLRHDVPFVEHNGLEEIGSLSDQKCCFG